MKKLIALLIVIGMVSASLQLVSYNTDPALLQPGISGTINAVIQNTGGNTIDNIIAESTGAFVSSQTKGLGSLKPGEKIMFTAPFNIGATNAQTSSTAYLKLTYRTNEVIDGVDSRTFSIPFIISDKKPSFTYTITPSRKEVSSGDVFELNVLISNSGSDVNNLILKTTSASQLELVDNEVLLGSLSSKNTISQTVKVKAKNGVDTNYYEVPLLLQYDLVSGTTQNTTIKTEPILFTQPRDLDVKLSQEKKLSAGTKGIANVILKNNGETDLENVAVTLDYNSSNIVALENTEKLIPAIKRGETISVPFNLAVRSDSLTTFQPLTIHVAYNKDGLAKTIVLDTALEIGGDSGLNVTASSDKPLTPGSAYTISFKTFNTGNTPIRALTLSIESEQFQLISEKESYIGTLNLDDEATIDKKMYLKKDVQPGSYAFRVRAYYKDALNDEQYVEIPVEYQVLTPEVAALAQNKSTDNTPLIIGAIILAIVGFLAWKRFKKK